MKRLICQSTFVVSKHRQRLGIAWAEDNCYGGKLGFYFNTAGTMNINEQVEKTPNENY